MRRAWSARTTGIFLSGRCRARNPRAENINNISQSIAAVVAKAKGREALFDAEHFFDGWRANPDYALACIRAAHEAGARWVVLCDTNGGTLPEEVFRIVTAR